jgi:hypothetical protein
MRYRGSVAPVLHVASLLPTLAVLSATPLGAQSTTFASPDDAVVQLKAEKGPCPTAEAFQIDLCGPDLVVRVVHPRLDANVETAVMEIPASQQGALVVLTERQDKRWEWADTLPVIHAYEALNVEYRPLVAPPVAEIVVHNNSDSWGHAYVGHLLVARLLDRRLRVVFAATEQEYVHMVKPWRDVASTFRFSPRIGERPASIIQTTLYATGELSYTITRTFEWRERYQVFLPVVGDELGQGRAAVSGGTKTPANMRMEPTRR